MSLFRLIRDSKLLRWPLLAISRFLFLLLRTGPQMLRRAVYDAIPVSYLVVGHQEYFVVSTSDKVIGRELFLRGEFDFEKFERALLVLKNEGISSPDHLIDVGANIGSIVIPALKRGFVKSATAIEPHPDNIRLLRANLAINDLTRYVNLLEIAVGDVSNCTLRLKESSTNSGNHSIDLDGILVSSMKLDDLALPRDSSLLWMDIEGYEGHALSGALDLLATGIPVVCEYNHNFLEKSAGISFFQNALADRRIFDLNKFPTCETTLKEIASSYSKGTEFTDILAIKR